MWTDIIDPFDIELDPKANIFDLDNTAMFLNHKNIFRPLRQVLANPKYDPAEVAKLKTVLPLNGDFDAALAAAGQTKQVTMDAMRGMAAGSSTRWRNTPAPPSAAS